MTRLNEIRERVEEAGYLLDLLDRAKEALKEIDRLDGYDGCYMWRDSRKILQSILKELGD